MIGVSSFLKNAETALETRPLKEILKYVAYDI